MSDAQHPAYRNHEDLMILFLMTCKKAHTVSFGMNLLSG